MDLRNRTLKQKQNTEKQNTEIQNSNTQKFENPNLNLWVFLGAYVW